MISARARWIASDQLASYAGLPGQFNRLLRRATPKLDPPAIHGTERAGRRQRLLDRRWLDEHLPPCGGPPHD